MDNDFLISKLQEQLAKVTQERDEAMGRPPSWSKDLADAQEDARQRMIPVRLIDVQWIEINLPWYKDTGYSGAPKQPDLEAEIKAKFGYTVDELDEENKAHIDIRYEILKHTYSDERDELLVKHKDHPSFIAHVEMCAKQKEIFEWIETHPATIEYVAAYNAWHEADKALSFRNCKLNNPGTLIKLSDGTIELIGSTNTAGGACDDCKSFDHELVVTHYAVMFDNASIFSGNIFNES